MRLAAAAVVAVLAGTGVRAGAQETGRVQERADVSLVEVAVRVLDRNGQAIPGLAAADFTLLDDGRPQQIVGFDQIDLASKDPLDGPLPPAARRRFLILFDLSFARARSIVAARRAASQFVLEEMSDKDLAAVATFSVESGVRLLVTFSSDRAQLVRAIDALGLQAPRGRSDPLQFAYETMRRGDAGAGRPGTAEGAASLTARQAEMLENLRAMSSISRARDDEYARGRVRSLLQSLRDLGKTLDAVEGRKDIVYLSEGFESRFLVGVEDTNEERQWLIQGEPWKVDSDKRFGNTPLRAELSEMGSALRRSDCVVHAVDIAGIVTDTEPDGAGESPPRRGAGNALFEMTSETGGEVLRNANDLGSHLHRLALQTSTVYVLAFRPDRAVGEGKYHGVKVKVSAPGARVLARDGYYERVGFRRRTPLERSLSAANIVANEIPFSDVPFRLVATPFAREGGPASVPVLLEVPGAPLLDGDAGDRTTLEFYAYAVDGAERLGDFFAQSLSVDLAAGGQRMRAGGLRYFGELALDPGDYRVRALVRNANTGKTGLSVLRLHVPAFTAGEALMLPPVFLESASPDWVSVRGRPAGDASPAPAGEPFGGLAGPNFVPAALASVAAGGSARVCVVAYHFGGAGDDFRIGSQILSAEGRPVEARGSVAVLGRSAPEADGKRAFLLSFTAPAGLTPGRYGLRIFMENAATSVARQAWTPFVVP